MNIKVLAAVTAMSVMAGGAALAQDYGTPPYASGAYGYADYDAGGCGGFTLAGAHAGVTVLGINVGAGARARIGGDCPRYAGGGGAAYAPQPVYQGPVYQGRGYPYPQPAYVQPVYQQPSYGYAPQPCGCQSQPYGYAQPY